MVALGNFDGLHLGHQAVISQAKTLAKKTGKPCAVMTFEPHPRRLFKPELPPLKLYPLHRKLHLLKESGVDAVFLMRFTRRFASLPAPIFLKDVLAEAIGASHIVTGSNFVFGHQRSGNTELLRQHATSGLFDYTAVVPVTGEGGVYSSTAVREALARGDLMQAARILGRPYSILGRIKHGDKRGRTIGFPTANIAPAHLFLSAFGVYAARLHLPGGSYDAVANLGKRPTFEGERILLETHVFDFDKEIYGEKAEVELLEFIRPEMKFNDVETLKSQIILDCEKSRTILSTALKRNR